MLMNHGQSGFGLEFVEGCLTVAAMVFAFALPRMGSKAFQAVERLFADIARKRHQSIFLVGLSTIVLRVAMLPLLPIPLPFVPDDFSFLLSADTFLHGRLTNPTPALWTHFETIHVTMRPTYASMYFPAEGLLLAASKAIFGHPWFGILGVTALMCAAICWMLQAWVPPQWALLGGLLATLHLGLFSYWVNTYAGGGSIAGLGGALILGALPRILRRVQSRHLLLLAVGVVLVGFTRPYEGTLLCVPVAIRLGIWLARGKNLPSKGMLLKMAALPLALIIGAVGWLGYYDYRNFGSATTLPYTVDRATYAIAPYFIWQKPRPEPHYRLASIRRFYEQELKGLSRSDSLLAQPSKLWPSRVLAFTEAVYFFCGFALLVPLIRMHRVLLDRRVRFALICMIILALGLSVEVYIIPHYFAPFTAAVYLLGIQAIRHLRVWRFNGELIGRALVRNSLALCCALVIIRPFDRALHIPIQEWPAANWSGEWFGPDQYGQARAEVARRLAHLNGPQLAIVRYSASHQVFDEWVYNKANIDSAKVIWANDMGPSENQELIDHYKDRKVWLVQPDLSPASVVPYPMGFPAHSGCSWH
jgi:hypothetical protein